MILKNLNRFPGNRKILKQIYLFFTNFDDIWLYNYDNVNYNYLIKSVFITISELE